MGSLPYKIFLSINFDDPKLKIETITGIAAGKNVELLVAGPGSTAKSPPEQILEMLRSVEGVLVVICQESSWIRNEIGMASALKLPVYLIRSGDVNVDDISAFLTSFKTVEINAPGQLEKAIGPALSHLIEEIDNNRSKKYIEPIPIGKPAVIFSWDSIYDLIMQAHRKIHLDPGIHGGFNPTLILGISRGGIIAADILSRLGGAIPLGMLEANRKSYQGRVLFKDEPLTSILKAHIGSLNSDEIRILVVDDVTKTCTTLNSALNKIKEICNSLEQANRKEFFFQTLVLIKRKTGKEDKNPGYFFHEVAEDTVIMLPWGLG